MDNRYEVFNNGTLVCVCNTYNAANNVKCETLQKDPNAEVNIFDRLVMANINPVFHVMNDDGHIVYYADTKDAAEKLAEQYTKKTGIDAFVLDNRVDYTGRAPKGEWQSCSLNGKVVHR